MPQFRSNNEFRRHETCLADHQDIYPIRSSEGLGWANVYAEVTHEQPHQATYHATRDIWFVVPLRPLKVRLSNDYRHRCALLPTDSVVLIGPKDVVHLELGNTTKVLHVFIRAELFREAASSAMSVGKNVHSPIVSTFGLHDRGLSLMLRSLKLALEQPGAVAALKADCLARAIALHTLALRGGRKQYTTSARQIRVFEPVIEHVKSNLSSALRIEDLAAIAGLGRSAFINQFRAAIGQTPHQYVMLERVNKACELLQRSELALSDIAYKCGFSDHAHMCSCFKSLIGVTPSNYRDEVCLDLSRAESDSASI